MKDRLDSDIHVFQIISPDHLNELLLAGILAHGPQHDAQLLMGDALVPVLKIFIQ